VVNEIQAYVKTWENRCYNTGIPDECPVEIDDMVPSYKKIAIAILKNDLRGLGFEPKQSKYYSILKRIEIQARATDPQLKLL
jgi:predicted phosphoadenosine phosphosulfate sulfurtransferase